MQRSYNICTGISVATRTFIAAKKGSEKHAIFPLSRQVLNAACARHSYVLLRPVLYGRVVMAVLRRGPARTPRSPSCEMHAPHVLVLTPRATPKEQRDSRTCAAKEGLLLSLLFPPYLFTRSFLIRKTAFYTAWKPSRDTTNHHDICETTTTTVIRSVNSIQTLIKLITTIRRRNGRGELRITCIIVISR